MIDMFATLLVLSQHANHSGTWISEIRLLKVLLLIVLIVPNWVQARLDAKLVSQASISLNVNRFNNQHPKEEKMKVKHKVMLISLAVVGLLLITTTSVFAKAVSFTQTFHNATQSFPVLNPCSGAPGTVTITYNGVFHVTMDTTTGTGHFTTTTAGNFVLVPDDQTQPTYTGHFAIWDGANQNIQNFAATETFNLQGTGSDGSVLKFHEVAHLSFSATGVTISFDKTACR